MRILFFFFEYFSLKVKSETSNFFIGGLHHAIKFYHKLTIACIINHV